MAILEALPEPDQAIGIINGIVATHNKICVDYKASTIKALTINQAGLIVPETKPSIISPADDDAEFEAMLAKMGTKLPPRKKIISAEAIKADLEKPYIPEADGAIKVESDTTTVNRLKITGDFLNLYMLRDGFSSHGIASELNDTNTSLLVSDYKNPDFAKKLADVLKQLRQTLLIEAGPEVQAPAISPERAERARGGLRNAGLIPVQEENPKQR